MTPTISAIKHNIDFKQMSWKYMNIFDKLPQPDIKRIIKAIADPENKAIIFSTIT